MSADTDRARGFYGQVFGWDCEDPNPEFGGYANFTRDGERIAGLMGKQDDAVPDVWSIYLEVADAEETVAKVTGMGLPVIVPAMPVGSFGTMAVVTDPTGAVIGMWQPDEHTGFSHWMDEPGTPGWFELHTRDLDSAVRFYEDVFGWTTHPASDEPGFRYTVQVEGESQYAGIMDASAFLPEGVPPHWSVYFHVDDADATAAQVVELGGSIVMPPEDTPYGRLATVTDPMGAMFKLHQ
jgi:predicted enzyme related to lactoylglutathione lyase